MAQRNKQERKVLMTRAGAAGSSSRTGPEDPRHRRGAQAEMEVEQRFDPDDFEVDDKQRVKKRDLPDPVLAQDAATKAYVDSVVAESSLSFIRVNGASLNFPNTSWTNGQLSLGSLYDPRELFTFDATADSITLKKGYAYVASWCGQSQVGTSASSRYVWNRLATASTGGTTYMTKDVTGSSEAVLKWYADVYTFGPGEVIDLTGAAGDVTLKHFCKCENASGSGTPNTYLYFLRIQAL